VQDYNEEDRKFFDKAVLAIITATINNEYTEDSLITRAFELARKMTVQRKNELYNLQEDIDVAQAEERECREKASKAWKAKKATEDAAKSKTM